MKKSIMIVALFISACATTGRQFDMSLADKIQIGNSTKRDVIAIMGKPLSESKTSDGRSFMAYYSGHASIGGATSQILSISIGPDGIVENTFSNLAKTD